MMMLKKLYYIFKENQYPEGLINRVVKSYFDKVHNSNNSIPPKDTTIIYFKLPFLNISNFAQRKVRMLVKMHCKDLQIKLAFTSFKIKNLITAKDCVPRSLRSNVVGETSRRLSTRVLEHLFNDKNSHFTSI